MSVLIEFRADQWNLNAVRRKKRIICADDVSNENADERLTLSQSTKCLH